MDINGARSHILTRSQLLGTMTEEQLSRAVRIGTIRRLRAGRYVFAETWNAQFAEGRHLLQVVAADTVRPPGRLVYSHCSATVAWQLPLLRLVPSKVHVSGPKNSGWGTGAGPVAYHEVAVVGTDRTVCDGIPCTSLERTVFDMVRTAPRESALAVADAALRRVAWHAGTRTYDEEAAESWRSIILGRIGMARGARGVRQARRIMELADGRAENPAESLSRLYIVDLGFAPPRVQVPFPGPAGERFEIDFEFADIPAWGEVDGVVKYTDPALLADRTAWDVVRAEKEREDWIRGRSQRRFARWGMTHLSAARSLGERLAQFHISPPGR